MSREIDLTKPLSEDELRYLVDRDRWDDLRANAEHLGIDAPNLPSARGIRAQVPRKQMRNTDAFDMIAAQLGVSVAKDDGEGTPTPVPAAASAETGAGKKVNYDKLTVPQLKEEMDKRRQDYEADEDGEGVQLMTYASDARKDDLVAALKLDDQAEPAD